MTNYQCLQLNGGERVIDLFVYQSFLNLNWFECK